jgi:hypothetical protein
MLDYFLRTDHRHEPERLFLCCDSKECSTSLREVKIKTVHSKISVANELFGSLDCHPYDENGYISRLCEGK